MSVQPFPTNIPIVDGVGKLTPFGVATLNALVDALGGVNKNGINTAQVGNIGLVSGAASPNGSVTAGPGTVYVKTTGGTGGTLWIKETGTGNTGWVAK